MLAFTVAANGGILGGMGKHLHIELTENERAELGQMIHAGSAPARKQTRARILLLSDRSQVMFPRIGGHGVKRLRR